MYSRPVISQEWSVHAQLTISQHRPGNNVSQQPSPRDPQGVRMEYSWNTQPSPEPSATPRPCYGFQRGNILFTTRPPARESKPTGVRDSGYSSEQMSYGSLPTRKLSVPYSRRCKSTCSIVLSGCGEPQEKELQQTSKCGDPVCYHSTAGLGGSNFSPVPEACEVCGGGRSPTAVRRAAEANTFTTHFCTRVPERTPQAANPRKFTDAMETPSLLTDPSNGTGCRDASSQTMKASQNRIKGVYAARRKTDSHLLQPPTVHLPDTADHQSSKPRKRLSRSPAKIGGTSPLLTPHSSDVGQQYTSDDSDNTTTPNYSGSPIKHFSKSAGSLDVTKALPDPGVDGVKCQTLPSSKQKCQVLKDLHSGTLQKITSVGTKIASLNQGLGKQNIDFKSGIPTTQGLGITAKQKTLVPGPTLGMKSKASADVKSPNSPSSKAPGPQGADNKQKPRTVHIDVYCTGSDSSANSESTEEGESWSSPQTVYESEELRVLHTRAGPGRLPHAFTRRTESLRTPPVKQKSVTRNYDSDDTGLRPTTRNTSSSTISSSSTAMFSDDSATSWKDTDLDSARQSGASLVAPSDSFLSQSDSFDTNTSLAMSDSFDSKSLTLSESLDCGSSSFVPSEFLCNASLTQSESFEYEDARDRLRIKEKERSWSKPWKCPQVERKHLLQQEKFREYLQKHLGPSSFPSWRSEASEESDDETGDAWSFCGREDKPGTSLKREDTVRRARREVLEDLPVPRMTRRTIGPFGSRSPSPPPRKAESSGMSPFTVQGKRTDQLSTAEKFGSIVGILRKPGHHVGPSKNPECTCEHCRKYYEEMRCRNRARSLNDVPQTTTKKPPSEFDTRSETGS